MLGEAFRALGANLAVDDKMAALNEDEAVGLRARLPVLPAAACLAGDQACVWLSL